MCLKHAPPQRISMPTASKCATASCGDPATARLGTALLCRAHFIARCYEELEACRRALQHRHSTDIAEEYLRRNLAACLSEATALAFASGNLSNLERAQLFDIVLSAAEASSQLRRSKRKTVCLPVRLACEVIGRTWAEVTHTRVISYHGACVECAHPIKIGETLTIQRLDTNRKTDCRVAWREQAKGGKVEIGIEFLTPVDFWQVDWTAPTG